MPWREVVLSLILIGIYRLGRWRFRGFTIDDAGIGALGLTAGITQGIGGSRGAALAAMAFLAVYPPLPIAAGMGLEATLFTFLPLLFTFSLTLKGPKSALHPASLLLMGIAMGLATPTRPEGLGVAWIFLAFAIIQWWQQRPLSSRSLLPIATWVSADAAILIPTLSELWTYYGSPVPNTVYANTAAGWMPDQYFAGFVYWLPWFTEPYNLALAPCLLWGMRSPYVRGRWLLAALIVRYDAYMSTCSP